MNTTTHTHPTLERLITLAARTFGKDAATLSSSDDFFEALGIDSMQAMDLLTELEDTFEVEIPTTSSPTYAPSANWPTSSGDASNARSLLLREPR